MASDRPQYVYLFRDGHKHKVGRSLNPPARLWRVVPSRHTSAHVVHAFQSADAAGVEAALHRRFAAYRVPRTREWFYLGRADVALICSVEGCERACDLPAELLDDPLPPQSNADRLWIARATAEERRAWAESRL